MVLDEEQEKKVAGLRSHDGFKIFLQWLVEEEAKEIESMLRATKEESMHKKVGTVKGFRTVRKFLVNCVERSRESENLFK